jgi:hypothetical protein
MMTQPWPQIVARYADYKGGEPSIRAMEMVARRISQSPLAKGLFAWTSMFHLCIVQIPVSFPYDGPLLRLSPVGEDRIEFRYVDTLEQARQWQRTEAAAQALPRLINFLDQLRWFPADVLESVTSTDNESL